MDSYTMYGYGVWAKGPGKGRNRWKGGGGDEGGFGGIWNGGFCLRGGDVRWAEGWEIVGDCGEVGDDEREV